MSDQEKAADTERKGNRLSKIVTRTGDAGTTGLGDGSRTTKDSLRIDAIGEVDELNSSLGLLLCEELPARVRAALLDIQHDLFDLGGELAMPDYQALQEAEVERLEAAIDLWNEELGPLRNFILPGGSRAVALAHVCRSLARGAERRCQHLNALEPLAGVGLAYINRLSDLLFVLARVLNRIDGGDDVYWKSERLARSQADDAQAPDA